MPRSMIVEYLPSTWRSEVHDLFIAVAGYEKRARYVAESIMPQSKAKACVGFVEQKVYSYKANLAWFKQNDFSVSVTGDQDFTALMAGLIPPGQSGTRLSIIVDISSMTRFRLACLMEVLSSEALEGELCVDFVYALAAYNPPPHNTVANSHVGAVIPSFAGWWSEPDRAVSAVVGLGYEEDRALGAVEYLQAADVWLFIPVSEVNEYSPAVRYANEVLRTDCPHRTADALSGR